MSEQLRRFADDPHGLNELVDSARGPWGVLVDFARGAALLDRDRFNKTLGSACPKGERWRRWRRFRAQPLAYLVAEGAGPGAVLAELCCALGRA